MKKEQQQTLVLVAALGAGGFVVYKLFGGRARGGNGSAASPAGYMPGYIPQNPYPAYDQTSLLQKILNALAKLGSGSGSGSGSGKSSGAGGSMSGSGIARSESISQALARGDYTGDNQNVLAGIWNIQQGYADFAGDTVASQGWYTDPAQFLNNYQIGLEDTTMPQLDLTGVYFDLPANNSYSYGGSNYDGYGGSGDSYGYGGGYDNTGYIGGDYGNDWGSGGQNADMAEQVLNY